MARLPRYVIPGQPQHIIQRGNNRQAIFAANADYQFFRDALVEAAEKHGLAIHAYVWMTNHVHLLATPEADDSISKTFQSVGRRYVQYFNYVYKRSGTLWEGRYRATVVDSERYLLILMRYIELNPVRAGMVALPQEYPWSSHRRNALGERGKNADWLQPYAEYVRLGQEDADRQATYRALFVAAIDPGDLAEIRGCTHKGWALGGQRFRAEIEALGQRQAVSKGVGRPRKEKDGGNRV
jgi:putative transposase